MPALSVNIEIKDSAGNTIKRAFDERNISVENFDLTNSPEFFSARCIEFNLTGR